MSDPLGLIGGQNIRPIAPLNPNAPAGGAAQTGGPNFKDVLLDQIEQVNKLQQEAQASIEDLAAGRRDDASSVMMAQQKAKLAFDMLLQVRNKMVAAYDEIKQMRV